MEKIRSLLLGERMRNRGLQFRRIIFSRNMLNQASAKLDVQELKSVTDCEERLVLRDRMAQQSAIGLLEVFVGCGRFRVWWRVVQGGINVRRAPGQDDR